MVILIFTGVKQDDWKHAAEVLNVYAKNPDNLVKVMDDEENNFTIICVQLSKKKDLFRKYGHVIELDGTYRINMQECLCIPRRLKIIMV
jgi:hypothetical protein